MKIGKILLRVFISLILIGIGIYLLYRGIYYNNLSHSDVVFNNTIDDISNLFIRYISINDKYILGDNIGINGTSSFSLTSEEYLPGSKNYNIINNLNNSNIKYSFIQDKNNKKLLFTSSDNNKYNYKYLIDNSTEYYFVNEIVNSYINNGSSNYFENFNDGVTNKDNVDYLYNFIIESIKNNLKSEYYRQYNVVQNINGEDTHLIQNNITIDNKMINKILNGVLSDLKSDEKSYKILSNIDSNFKKREVSVKLLTDKEKYEVNIYTTTTFYKRVKYEVVYINNDNKKSISYIGNINKGNIYYIDNSNIEFKGKVSLNKKNINIKFTDYNNDNIGNLKYSRELNSDNFSLLLNYDNKMYNIVYSNKYIDYKKNRYNNEISTSFKITNNKKITVSGNIRINNSITKGGKIDEDTSNSVIMKSLDSKKQEAFNNYYKTVKGRYES